MTFILIGLTFAVSSSLASTVMCVTNRSLQHQPILLARSHCDYCGMTLIWWQLLPCLGWLLQVGRCHNCQQKISLSYPLAELMTGAVGVLAYEMRTPQQLLLHLLFILILLALSVIDAIHLQVPVLGLLGLLLTGLLLNPPTVYHLLTVLICYLFLNKCPLTDGWLGKGDLDFFAISWLTFNFQTTTLIIFTASMLALVHNCHHSKQTKLPFFPYLWVATSLVILWRLSYSY